MVFSYVWHYIIFLPVKNTCFCVSAQHVSFPAISLPIYDTWYVCCDGALITTDLHMPCRRVNEKRSFDLHLPVKSEQPKWMY